MPSDVHLTITRDYGETAAEKSNELLWHMLLAVLSVSALIWLVLGRREAAVVLIAIPVTLALTLFMFYLYGYTLNRITLFALIFSIGILVDDAIVVVENIVRHARLSTGESSGLAAVALRAVDEVGNPTILATLAVVAAILPMAFVGGLMGPYMRPIPVGASAAMVFSLVVAFVVTPWAAVRLLKPPAHHEHGDEDLFTRLYRRVMGPLIASGRMRALFLAGVAVLLLAAMALVPLELVTVKMLPFDNKSEFQVMVDMPEGTALETTARVASALASATLEDEAVVDVQQYVGHVGAVQLQRARASLLSAPCAAPGRSAGEPRAQGRAVGAEPRRGAARARAAAADRAVVRRHAAGGGGAAGTARPADARRRSLRTRRRRGGRRWPRRSRRSSSRRRAWWTPTGTSRRRIRRSRSPWMVKRPRRRGSRRPPWRRWSGWPARERSPACCTMRRRARTCRSSSACRARTAVSKRFSRSG